jgi:hypothetical protein
LETSIQVVWWIGLSGALIATLVILKEVFVLLRVLHGIRQLAGITREASEGIARNAAATPRLAGVADSAQSLRDAANALAAAAGSLERGLEPLADRAAGRRR